MESFEVEKPDIRNLNRLENVLLEAIITTSFSPAALQHFSPKGNSHFQSEKNIE
jgi:hypothetical protein